MRYVIILIFVLNIPFSSISHSQEAAPSNNYDNILKKLEENSRTINTLKGNFLQTKHIYSLNIQIESKGLFYYKKENQKIRWEYSQPSKFSAIFNNGDFNIRNQDNSISAETNKGKLFTELNTVILSSLEGSLSKLDDFELSVYELEFGYLISLIPNSNISISKLLTKIDIQFNNSDYTVSKIELFELNGDITSISFQSLAVNPSISDNLFNIQ